MHCASDVEDWRVWPRPDTNGLTLSLGASGTSTPDTCAAGLDGDPQGTVDAHIAPRALPLRNTHVSHRPLVAISGREAPVRLMSLYTMMLLTRVNAIQ